MRFLRLRTTPERARWRAACHRVSIRALRRSRSLGDRLRTQIGYAELEQELLLVPDLGLVQLPRRRDSLAVLLLQFI